VAYSPKTARTCNSKRKNRHVVVNAEMIVLVRTAARPRVKCSVFGLLQKTVSDDDARTDSGRLFQTDAAVAGRYGLRW